MFNTTIIAPGPRHIDHHHHTEVHEHRAPTDHSVQLLKDMEEKARAKVIESIAVENNAWNCVIHQHVDMASDRLIAIAYFAINGRKMEAKADISNGTGETRETLFNKLRDAIATKIANEALADAWRTLFQRYEKHG